MKTESVEEVIFPLPDEMMVVTSTYVTSDGMPVLYVTHEKDEDGEHLWQFHCGNNDYDMSRMQLVRFDTIKKIDSSVCKLAGLPLGFSARRSSKDQEWTVFKE